MPDGTIAVTQTGRVIAQDLPAAEGREDVDNNGRVGMELGDVAPDVLLARVPQEVEFRLIRPEDRTVGPDPMQAYRRAFDEIAQGSFTPAQGLELELKRVVVDRTSCFAV